MVALLKKQFTAPSLLCAWQHIVSKVLKWARCPWVQITIFGFLSWLAYFHLASIYPLTALVDKYALTDFGRMNNYSRETLVDFIESMAVPFGLYLITWKIVQRHGTDRRVMHPES